MAGSCLDVWRPNALPGHDRDLRPATRSNAEGKVEPPKGARRPEDALCVAPKRYLSNGLTWD